MTVGYARVSTLDQTLDLQKDALTRAGCERIFTDTMSGAKVERPGLVQALTFMRAGDVLVVWKLDRLGRSLKNLIDAAASQTRFVFLMAFMDAQLDFIHIRQQTQACRSGDQRAPWELSQHRLSQAISKKC